MKFFLRLAFIVFLLTPLNPIVSVVHAASTQYFQSTLKFQIVFTEWNDLRGKLAGKLHVARLDEANPIFVVSNAYTFTGIKSGSGITLRLEDGDTYTGIVSKKQLTLNVPSGNGQIDKLILTTASLEIFNREVVKMKKRAAENYKIYETQRQKQERTNELANKVRLANDTLNRELNQIKLNLQRIEEILIEAEKNTQLMVREANKRDIVFSNAREVYERLKPLSDASQLPCFDAQDYVKAKEAVENQYFDENSRYSLPEGIEDNVKYTYTSQVISELKMLEANFTTVEKAFSNLETVSRANSIGVPKPNYNRNSLDNTKQILRSQISALAKRASEGLNLLEITSERLTLENIDSTRYISENFLECVDDSNKLYWGRFTTVVAGQTWRLDEMETAENYRINATVLVYKNGYFSELGALQGIVRDNKIEFQVIDSYGAKISSFKGTFTSIDQKRVEEFTGVIIFYNKNGKETLKQQVKFVYELEK